jgi:hypothetical protein
MSYWYRRVFLLPVPLILANLTHGPALRRLFALNRDILLRTLSLVAAYAWSREPGRERATPPWPPDVDHESIQTHPPTATCTLSP